MSNNGFEKNTPNMDERFKIEVSEQGEINPDKIRAELKELDGLVESFSANSLVSEASRESGLSEEEVGKIAQKNGEISRISKVSKGLKQKLGVAALLGATLIASMPAKAEAQEIQETEDRTVAAEPASRRERVEFGFDNLKRAPLIDENGLETTAPKKEFGLDINVIEQATYGNFEANYWIDQLGETKDVAVIQSTMDHYYLFCPQGTVNRWGDGWLNKFVLRLFVQRAYDLRDKLSSDQMNQLETILADAAREETFILDGKCGLNPGNSCSEDGISEVAAMSWLLNSFPKIAAKIGVDYLHNLQKKYLKLAFSTENGWYSLVKEETQDGVHIVVHNHDQQSAVYAGIIMIYLNLALEAYNESGNPVPSYYKEKWLIDNIVDMFRWQQSVSTTDGRSYLNACKGIDGSMQSCADINTTNAIPQVIPSGRLIHNLIEAGIIPPDAIKQDAYDFRLFDERYAAPGNMSNRGRQADFNSDNGEFTPKFVEQEVARIVRRRLGR